MSHKKTIIEISNVSKQYKTGHGTLTVLNNVNFNIEDGDFVTIVGGSGCGKSTLPVQ